MSIERVSTVSTIIASAVAICALFIGLYQFTETQKMARENLRLQAETLEHERDSKAVELFLKFNEMQKDVAAKPLPKRGDAAFWHHNMMLTLTESVFRLTEGDAGWRETVAWMLEAQRPFLEAVPHSCKTFAESFIALARSATTKLKCVS